MPQVEVLIGVGRNEVRFVAVDADFPSSGRAILSPAQVNIVISRIAGSEGGRSGYSGVGADGVKHLAIGEAATSLVRIKDNTVVGESE